MNNHRSLSLWILEDTAGGYSFWRQSWSIAGRTCLVPSHLSRPDIAYFTHDWRNWGIKSHTFLSSSLWCMMNLCDFSLISVSLLIRPMKTVCSVHSWKASPSFFTLTWVWRTAQSTPSPPCSLSPDLGSPYQVLSLGMTGPFSSPTTLHTSPCCWPRPSQLIVSHRWGRTLLCSHLWCRTWGSTMVSRGSCSATTWSSGCTSWCLWTLWPFWQGRGSRCPWSATSWWI